MTLLEKLMIFFEKLMTFVEKLMTFFEKLMIFLANYGNFDGKIASFGEFCEFAYLVVSLHYPLETIRCYVFVVDLHSLLQQL